MYIVIINLKIIYYATTLIRIIYKTINVYILKKSNMK